MLTWCFSKSSDCDFSPRLQSRPESLRHFEKSHVWKCEKSWFPGQISSIIVSYLWSTCSEIVSARLVHWRRLCKENQKNFSEEKISLYDDRYFRLTTWNFLRTPSFFCSLCSQLMIVSDFDQIPALFPAESRTSQFHLDLAEKLVGIRIRDFFQRKASSLQHADFKPFFSTEIFCVL